MVIFIYCHTGGQIFKKTASHTSFLSLDLRNGLQNLLTGEVQCFIHGAGPGKVFISKLLEETKPQKKTR